MAFDDDDARRLLEEEAWLESFEEWFPEALYERSADIASRYLRMYGDSVQQRVDASIGAAKELLSQAQLEAAVLLAFTAIELIVGYLLFRPLFMGALLSEELADRLVRELFARRSQTQRAWLPWVLRHWKIDVESLELSTGEKLWAAVTRSIPVRRNAIAHEGARATDEDARLTIEAESTSLELPRSGGLLSAEVG